MNDYSRRDFLKLIGMGAAAMALPGTNFIEGKTITPKIGLQLYTIRKEIEKDLTGTIKKIADKGYLGIETFPLPESLTAEQATKAFKEYGLEVLGMHNPLPVGEDRDKALKLAEVYNCKNVIYAGWPAGDKYKDKDAINRTADLYNETAAFLKTRGLNLGLHNHWWEFEESDGVIPFYYMLEHLDKDIFFELDTYWVEVSGQKAQKVVHDFGKRVPFMHIKDGPAVKGDQAMNQVPLGKGNMNFPAIVKAASSSTRWMIVEFDEYKGDIFEGVKTSYDYLIKKRFAKGKY